MCRPRFHRLVARTLAKCKPIKTNAAVRLEDCRTLKETVKRVEQRSGQESKKFGVFGVFGSSSFTMGNVIVEQCGDYCEDYQYGSAPMWIEWSSGCSQ
tara:strand:- start:136 stop:429 length:294 start_codon:yes stop_codon:yes gene_type:complete